MKTKITFITILLICFAFSMACNVSLGNESDTETVSTKFKETSKKKPQKDVSEDKEEKDETKSLLQSDNDYDPDGATKSDDYDNKTYLNQNGGRIRFKRGESSAVVSGKIKNGNEVTYIIGAKAGQTLYVNITEQSKNNDVVFHIIAPNGETAGSEDDDLQTTWRGELPQTGDYKIVFGAFESTNTNFTFFISIE